jgi:hypothetical protein
MKMNRFNRIRNTVRRTPSNKTRRDAQIQFYRAMAVTRTLTCGPEIWTVTKKKKETCRNEIC